MKGTSSKLFIPIKQEMSFGEFIKGWMRYFLAFMIVGVILALPIMVLWNLLMPVIFGLVKITYIQALYMFMLVTALFMGVGKH